MMLTVLCFYGIIQSNSNEDIINVLGEINYMSNEELINVNNEGELLETNYKRVDFEDPSTILSYGSDLKEEIIGILGSASDLATADSSTSLTEEDFEKIVKFDEELGQAKSKKEDESLIAKGILAIRKKINPEKVKKEQSMRTYKGRYDSYCEKIEELVEGMQKMQEDAAISINLRQEFIKELEPKIKELEKLVKIGYVDKATYEQETASLKSMVDPNGDVKRNIDLRTKIAEVFDKKLNDLSAAVVMYKEQVQAYRMQQVVGTEIAFASSRYIEDAAPILKAQGSEMVMSAQQTEELNLINIANKAANEALRKNGEKLNQNIEMAMEVAVNGNITTETLQILDETHKKGIEIIKNGREEQKKRLASDRLVLESINKSITQERKEIIDLLGDSEELKDTLKIDTNKIKKLGSKN